MTRVEFFNEEGRINGFCVSGHSDYAEAGADIVCASVSTAVQFATATIVDVMGERATSKVDEHNAQITFKLPSTCENEDAVQDVLCGMMNTLLWVAEQYPENIEVLEV